MDSERRSLIKLAYGAGPGQFAHMRTSTAPDKPQAKAKPKPHPASNIPWREPPAGAKDVKTKYEHRPDARRGMYEGYKRTTTYKQPASLQEKLELMPWTAGAGVAAGGLMGALYALIRNRAAAKYALIGGAAGGLMGAGVPFAFSPDVPVTETQAGVTGPGIHRTSKTVRQVGQPWPDRLSAAVKRRFQQSE